MYLKIELGLFHSCLIEMLIIRVFWIFVNFYFGSLNNKAFITGMKLALTLLLPTVTVHCIHLWQKRAVIVHLIDPLIAWGYQGGDFVPFSSLGLPEYILFALWQPDSSHSAQNGQCDSLGWQGEDFAFPISFLILNEIMLPGDTVQLTQARPRLQTARIVWHSVTPWLLSRVTSSSLCVMSCRYIPMFAAVLCVYDGICLARSCAESWGHQLYRFHLDWGNSQRKGDNWALHRRDLAPSSDVVRGKRNFPLSCVLPLFYEFYEGLQKTGTKLMKAVTYDREHPWLCADGDGEESSETRVCRRGEAISSVLEKRVKTFLLNYFDGIF